MPITLPFTFTNGTVADATQVNANMGALANGAFPTRGVTDGSNAAPGEVGEYMTNNATMPVLGNGTTVVAITSLNLTPGDWELGGEIGFSGGDCTAFYTDFAPASNAPTPSRGATVWTLGGGATLVDGTTIPTYSGVRVLSATAQQVFLRAEASSVGGVVVQVWGEIWARRVR